LLYATVALYNQSGGILKNKIRSFRKTLRKFEREIEKHLESTRSCGIGLAQCHALLELEDLGITTIGGLASSLNLDKSTASRTVDGLVAAGLVQRTADTGDRRFSRISLTRDGIEKCIIINRMNDDFFEGMLELVSGTERDGLIKYFMILTDALAECNSPDFRAANIRAESRCRIKGGQNEHCR
jgi:DNA-binding MarR family transcriptional regulator